MNATDYLFLGGTLGMILGALLTLLSTRKRMLSALEDAANHYYAATELSRKLAEARRENEQLTEQVDALLSMSSEPDPADAWKADKPGAEA